MRAFDDLTEREVLALAISNEEEDGRIYADFAHGLRGEYPDTARVFDDMAAEENEHRRRLIDTFTGRFGDHIPLVRRADVKGNLARKPPWQVRPLGIHVTLVEPGPFRTDWAGRSIVESRTVIDDYDATAGARRRQTRERSGNQVGDPVRAAEAVIAAVTAPAPPLRLLLGAPALELAYGKLDRLRANFDLWKETTLGADYPEHQKTM